MSSVKMIATLAGVLLVACLCLNGSTRLLAQFDAARRPPGGMRLLEGYRHEALKSVDTYGGRIWKDGGPELIYELGDLATNNVRHYRERDSGLWYVVDKDARGISLEAIMTDDETLHIALPGARANFMARKLKSKADVAEVLLMLMSYSEAKGLMEAR